MNLGLQGAAVCISGGTKGMGREAAELFAREGARVVVTGRHQDSIDTTVAKLMEAGSPDAFGVKADILSARDIDGLFQQIDRRWGELNTLVNMAGPADPPEAANFAELTDEAWTYF